MTMIRSILFQLLFISSLIAITPTVAAQTSGETDLPWATIGTGGAHLLAEPGPLEIRIHKRNLARARDLHAILLSPDRELVGSATISGSDERGSAVLRTEVERRGIYLLQIIFPGDRYGVRSEWSIETNAAGWVLEIARGHRDDRHREPIVMNNPERSAEIVFLPRKGEFVIEAEGLLPKTGPFRLYDANGKLVSEIPVAEERRKEIREYMRNPLPSEPEASVFFTVPASEDRGDGPWRLEIPSARFYLEIDGLTRWVRDDFYPDQAVWTPVADSWFPFSENRWMISPYSQTVYVEPRKARTIAFTIHNNSPRSRTFDLSLEFPERRWNAKLEQDSVSLDPGQRQEVSIRFTGQRDGEQRVHLRATPRDDSSVSTYATLRTRAGESPAEKAIELPLVLRPYAHENRQFGYVPDYPRDNQVYFDPENRGFILNGRQLYRQTDSGWVTIDLRRAVTKTVPETDASNWTGLGSKVAFDAAGNVYVLARSGRTVALLRSTDRGESFTAHIIEGRENESRSWDLEQFTGHNTPEGPPAVVRMVRTSRGSNLPAGRRPQAVRWRTTNDLELIVAEENASGELVFHEPVKLTEFALGAAMHSSVPSMAVSRDEKIHVVWGEATDPEASLEDIPGVPAYVATYDRNTREIGEPVFMNFGPPPNDGHNTPSITIDSKGYLHVVVGTHGRPFQYLRSLEPNDAYGGWTESIRTSEENLRQTYVGLVCDDEDNLHLVFRLWRVGEEHLGGATWAALAHQRKPADGEWEAPQILVAPPMPDYSIYYHRLTVDRNGDLHVNYDYWSTSWFYRNDAFGPGGPGRGWGRSILTSPDSGETWKFW